MFFKRLNILIFLLLSSINFFSLSIEGFPYETLILTPKGYRYIGELGVGDKVISYDFVHQTICQDTIIEKHYELEDGLMYGSYADVTYYTNDGSFRTIECGRDTKFLCPEAKKWVKAKNLKHRNNYLLASPKPFLIYDVEIANTGRIGEPYFYTLTIEKNHNYFITKDNILVHNIPISVNLLEFIVEFGQNIEVYFSGLIAGLAAINPVIAVIGGIVVVGGLGSCIIYDEYKNRKEYNAIAECKKLSSSHSDVNIGLINKAAKAPGIPTEKDGFEPSKNWDGKKKKHEGSGNYGYPDKHGNVWIPTGDTGHGGAHWDVQKVNGGYNNIFPGGKVRPGKK